MLISLAKLMAWLEYALGSHKPIFEQGLQFGPVVTNPRLSPTDCAPSKAVTWTGLVLSLVPPLSSILAQAFESFPL